MNATVGGSMRICLVTLSELLTLLGGGLFASPDDGDDPYSVNLVGNVLHMRQAQQTVIFSQTQKALGRLGDDAAIAIVKILSGPELVTPSTIDTYLPIIRAAFSTPALIARSDDRKPKVTLFLLQYLAENITDPQCRSRVQETINFVKAKGTGSS
jgi:hypothetical protein